MANIFHMVPRELWEEGKKAGSYEPASLSEEGFIHCSHTDQLLEVANKLYRGHQNMIILRIVEEKVVHEIKNEPPNEAPMSGILYPHIYGPLNPDAVDKEIDFPCNEDGTFNLPRGLLS